MKCAIIQYYTNIAPLIKIKKIAKYIDYEVLFYYRYSGCRFIRRGLELHVREWEKETITLAKKLEEYEFTKGQKETARKMAKT